MDRRHKYSYFIVLFAPLILIFCNQCNRSVDNTNTLSEINAEDVNTLDNDSLRQLVEDMKHSFVDVEETLGLARYKYDVAPNLSSVRPVRRYFLKHKLLYIYLSADEKIILDSYYKPYPSDTDNPDSK